MAFDPLLRARYEEIAKDVNTLIWRIRREEGERWDIERLAWKVWWLLASVTPNAAELIQEGMDVDEALDAADEGFDRNTRLLGL